MEYTHTVKMMRYAMATTDGFPQRSLSVKAMASREMAWSV